tara:strand:+ start:585 stop:1808 length:1224 start_codon:yes stop_codon:yes gene_type:complete
MNKAVLVTITIAIAAQLMIGCVGLERIGNTLKTDTSLRLRGSTFVVNPLPDITISSAGTGEKPQSKVWFHADHWWAALPATNGTKLWRLDNSDWNEGMQLAHSPGAKPDVRSAGDEAHILLHEGTATRLVSIEYDPTIQNYRRWVKRPNDVLIPLAASSETATIDVDTSGRMWLASDSNPNSENPLAKDVVVRWSDPPYAKWNGPLDLAQGINKDDICVVTAFPNGDVGVLWSNQDVQRFGFRLHKQGSPPEKWSVDEVPASDSALAIVDGMADDHLNTAVASDGTLYAAVKTGYDTAGYPLIALLVRRPSGNWDPLYEVDDAGSRGIVLLDEERSKVSVVYTSYVTDTIVSKTSDTQHIRFGPRETLLKGQGINNVTSAKHNCRDEIVILAKSQSRAKGALLRRLE